jgi:hypothetical protein
MQGKKSIWLTLMPDAVRRWNYYPVKNGILEVEVSWKGMEFISGEWRGNTKFFYRRKKC